MWRNPVPFDLRPTTESESFKDMAPHETGLPLPPHPGAFGVWRKHHVHEGVDLYVPEGTLITAVEDGEVVGIMPFTGEHAGSPWWRNTWAVMVEGQTGVVLYGELEPLLSLRDRRVMAGDLIGNATTVLTKDKGRPMCMLHLELYEHGVREPMEWKLGEDQPFGLCDPTPYFGAAVD